MTPEVREVLAELKRQFQELYGDRLVKMLLYGSHARGDAEPGSDIDVLVVLKGPVVFEHEIARTSEITSDVSLEHNVVLSRLFVSEDDYSDERTHLVTVARRQGVPL